MKAFTNLPLGGSNPPQRTRNTSDRKPASSGQELGHRCMVTNISAPAQTHILKPPVSQSVINRPKQQALSPRLLLPANYELCRCAHRPTHAANIRHFYSATFALSPLFVFYFVKPFHRHAHTHTHPKKNMEMLLGQLPPVAMTQYTSSVTAHLESREEQQEQEDGEK